MQASYPQLETEDKGYHHSSIAVSKYKYDIKT
jgi:hypothetical protein